MVAILLLADAWALMQIALLTAPWRTVGIRTIALAFCAGFGVTAPLVLFIQWAWVNAYQDITGTWSFVMFFPGQLVETAGYTVDPFLEEIGKLLPLILLMVLPRTKYRLGLSDSLVLGAALGAGFGFAEQTMRITEWVPERGLSWSSFNQAWTVPFFLSTLYIPGPLKILTSWIPNATQWHSLPSFEWLGTQLELTDFHRHLVWSAVAGLGVGVLFRVRSRLRWLGALLWLWAGFDHVFVNFVLSSQKIYGFFAVAAVFSALTGFGQWATLALAVGIAVACLYDAKTQQRALREAPELWLAEEKQLGFPFGSILAFLKRPPRLWGAIIRFMRERNNWAYAQRYLAESPPQLHFRQELSRIQEQLCTGASQGSETTKTKPSLSAILVPLVSLGVGFFYFFALSTITDKNLVKTIRYIVFLPAIILLIICLIRSFIYLFYFHKNWASLSQTALGGRVVALTFLGLLLYSSTSSAVLVLIRVPGGLEQDLIRFHILNAAKESDIIDTILFILAIISLPLIFIPVPAAITLAVTLPNFIYTAFYFITGQQIILTNRGELKLKPVSETERGQGFIDLFLDTIQIGRVLKSTRITRFLRRFPNRNSRMRQLGGMSQQEGSKGLDQFDWASLAYDTYLLIYNFPSRFNNLVSLVYDLALRIHNAVKSFASRTPKSFSSPNPPDLSPTPTPETPPNSSGLPEQRLSPPPKRRPSPPPEPEPPGPPEPEPPSSAEPRPPQSPKPEPPQPPEPEPPSPPEPEPPQPPEPEPPSPPEPEPPQPPEPEPPSPPEPEPPQPPEPEPPGPPKPEPPQPPEPEPPGPPEPEPPQPPEPEPPGPPELVDLLSRAEQLSNDGETLLEQNRLAEANNALNQALDLYQQALQRATQEHNPVGQARAWTGIGRTLLLLGRLEEARPALETALNMHRQLAIRGEPLVRLLALVIEARQNPEAVSDLALEAISETQTLPQENQISLFKLLEGRFRKLGLVEWAERCLAHYQRLLLGGL
jgi:hypothetical protein